MDEPTLVFLSKEPRLPSRMTSSLEVDLNNEQVVLERANGSSRSRARSRGGAWGCVAGTCGRIGGVLGEDAIEAWREFN